MKTVDIDSPKYPDILKQIHDPPKRLYYKGEWDIAIFDKCLAVVGSRRMTSYGKRATDELISKAAAAGITIISGFMYGIDAQAHRAALLGGGRSIAVMPCGINLIHPEYQKNLYRQILKNGGIIISEYKDDSPPAIWTYPQRNRIVAGLSQATLVIEATLKSGSLITANFAKRFNRKLMAVPGPITNLTSQGTLQLIRDGEIIITSADDILSEYGLTDFFNTRDASMCSKLSAFERTIVERLQLEPMRIDSLSRILKTSTSKLGTAISA